MAKLDTYYAPPQRVAELQLRLQVAAICNSPVMDVLLETAAGLLVVINEQRQIVGMNKTFIETLGIDDPEGIFGFRLGEALSCKYAFDEPDGCGTTKYCSSCGAVICMMSAIDDDRTCERICAVKTAKNGAENDLCLLVRSQPLVVDGQRWILVFAQDITEQHFRATIENAFFHDINNMLCSIKNYSEYIHDHTPTPELIARLKSVADRACREVKLQSMFAHYKNWKDMVTIGQTSLRSIRDQVFSVVLTHSALAAKEVIEEECGDSMGIATDPLLASRILINMLVNALEATEEFGKVIFRTELDASAVTWHVWSKSFIPENIQLRIFQKYFSTKHDVGHGLGTYSMKLFGEECLGGKVNFTSTVEEGTTFTFSLPL